MEFEMSGSCVFGSWMTRKYIEPQWFDRAKLLIEARRLLNKHDANDEFWALAALDTRDSVAIVADALTTGLDLSTPYGAEMIGHRHEMLRLLVRKSRGVKMADRAAHALELLGQKPEVYTGWQRLIADADRFQLGSDQPWYHRSKSPGLYADMVHELDAETLSAEGYELVDQEEYRRLVQRDLMLELLAGDRASMPEMWWAATAVVMLTEPLKNWRTYTPARLIESLFSKVRRQCEAQLQQVNRTRVPMRGVYSLPRQANTLKHFFLLAQREHMPEPTRDGVPLGLEDTLFAQKAAQGSSAQVGLLLDKRLIRPSENRGTFFSLPLEQLERDPIHTLLKAVEKLDVDASVCEHLPRVLTGMFAAARRDSNLLPTRQTGTFWDTDSGYRICQIVGFDPNNWRHLQRVQQIRKLLLELRLHCEIVGRNAEGEVVTIHYKAPIIEQRAAEIEVVITRNGKSSVVETIRTQENLSKHHKFTAWSINEHLWNMTLPAEEGGAPSFMLIDDRAFHLGARSSAPFNIYWTLLNRAYMSALARNRDDMLNEDGTFAPRLGVLFDFAGLETTVVRVSRVRKQFKDALDLMVENGLLLDWDCELLRSSKSVTLEAFKTARVRVRWPENQVNLFLREKRDAAGKAALEDLSA